MVGDMSDDELSRVPDGELADRYWGARQELVDLRRDFRDGSAVDRPEGASSLRRVRELDEVCGQLWRESRRRTQAGSIAGA
jgi:hypothetical protein